MPEQTVLVVDDRPNMLGLVKRVLEHDVRVLTAASGRDALDVLSHHPVSVVVCDLKMPDMEGLEVLRHCKRSWPDTEFILMTAFASVSTAVEALRLGAYDYITKPFEPDAFREVVRRALGSNGTASDGKGVENQPELLPGIVGRSSAMRQLAQVAREYARGNAAILILGESGTGKERLARAIHALSSRARQPFLTLNCAAVSAEAVHAELFGPDGEMGPHSRCGGLLDLAGGGTLYLDQVGELTPTAQARLTRVLEEQALDVRVIASSDADLGALVRDGAFSGDLLSRLGVARLQVPPLRVRREDVAVLASYFLSQRSGALSERRVDGFTPEALARLASSDWPGNLRQLRSCVERACRVTVSNLIGIRDLPDETSNDGSGGIAIDFGDLSWQAALDHSRELTARRYLAALLERFHGRVTEAAAHAGVERESFYRLLRRYGMRAD